MKYLAVIVLVLFTSCRSINTTCDSSDLAFFESRYSGVTQAETTFTFSCGRSIAVVGYIEDLNDSNGISEYALIECITHKTVGAWSAGELCHLSFGSDSLKVQQLEYLPIGESFAFKLVPWKIFTFYCDDERIESNDRFNPLIHYTQKEIESTLALYDTCSKRYTEGKSNIGEIEDTLNLSGRLFVSSVSGSVQARKLLQEYRMVFDLDGAYREYYDRLIAMLQYADSMNRS
jgi:hypothetical protein